MKTVTITISPCRNAAISLGSVVFTVPVLHEPTVAEQRSLLKTAQAQMEFIHAHRLVDRSVIPECRHGEAEVRYEDTVQKSEGVSGWLRTGKAWSPRLR